MAAVSTMCPPRWIEQAARAPTIILHAVEDGIFPIEGARNLRDRLASAGGKVDMQEFPGGHDGLRIMKAYELIFDWFDAHTRPAGSEKKLTP